MITILKLAKDLNNISLAELISSLRSHEIDLEQDEPCKEGKFVALKYFRIYEKTKALHEEEEEESEEDS